MEGISNFGFSMFRKEFPIIFARLFLVFDEELKNES